MQMKLSNVWKLNNIIKEIIDSKTITVSNIMKFRLLGIAKELEPHITNFELIKDEKIREYGSPILGDNDVVLGHEVKENTKEMDILKADLEEMLMSDVDVNIRKLSQKEAFESGLSTEYLVDLYEIIEE